MEPWRAAVVDSFCLSLVTHHEIDKDCFVRNDDNGGVYLNRVGRRIFIQAYELIFMKTLFAYTSCRIIPKLSPGVRER